MKEKKGVRISIFIIVIIFLLLIVGATYAYFKEENLAFGSTNVNTNFENVGISKLVSKNNLKLKLSLVDMMKKSKTITYYATLDGTPTTDENDITIATALVDGNGLMNCNYSFSISASGTNNMYDAFLNMPNKSDGQLVLNVDGTDYDLYNISSFPLIVSGTVNGISEDISKDIKASFKLVNRVDIDQSYLADKDLILEFNIISYECFIVG